MKEVLILKYKSQGRIERKDREKHRALKSRGHTEFKGNVKTKNRRKGNERLDNPTESLEGCRL